MADLVMGGKLIWGSTTQLKLIPYGGDRIKLAGVLRQIPIAGVLAANTNVWVGGVAAQNLVANTTYLVNLIDVSGTLTLEFRTSLTHAPSQSVGNEGVEVWSGDVTRSVVGMIRTDAGALFQDTPAQRFVSSWYNPSRRLLQGAALGTISGVGANAELGTGKRVEWVAFDREVVDVSIACNVSNNTAGGVSVLNLYINPVGAYAVENAYSSQAANAVGCASTRYCKDIVTVGEGYGFATPYGAAYNSGASTFGQVLVGGPSGSIVGHLTG